MCAGHFIEMHSLHKFSRNTKYNPVTSRESRDRQQMNAVHSTRVISSDKNGQDFSVVSKIEALAHQPANFRNNRGQRHIQLIASR